MRALRGLIAASCLAFAACGGESTPTDAPQGPGGSITIGEQSWTIVPRIQCSVFPGPIINIAGYAAEDESVEIVIDYGGPTGVRVGGSDSPVSWYAVRTSIEIEIDGRFVRGSARFTESADGTGKSAEGIFSVTCR